jgi:hypothetical protein
MPLFCGIPLYLDISQLECIWLKFIAVCLVCLCVCVCVLVWLRF